MPDGRVPTLDSNGRLPNAYAPQVALDAYAKANAAVPNTPAGRAALASSDELTHTMGQVFDTRLAGVRTVLGPRWVFDGDSIVIENIVSSAGIQGRGEAWATMFEAMTGGRVQMVYNAAVAGQRSDQALARFDTYVAPWDPDVVSLSILRNDVLQGVAESVSRANIIAYHEKCKAIGATLVLGALWPSSDAPAGAQAKNRSLSDWIYSYAATHGLVVIPWDALTDPATGSWPSGWSGDGVHPANAETRSKIAAFGLSTLEPVLGAPSVRLPTANGRDALANGFMTARGSVMPAPTSVTPTAATDSGTLPAGTYEYRVATRTRLGEGVKSAAASATLTGPGKITVAVPAGAPASNAGFAVYRKGPGDASFLFLAQIAQGSYSYVDDGSVAPTPGDTGPTQDTSAIPTGWGTGTGARSKRGGGFLANIEGFRGIVYRTLGAESIAVTQEWYANIPVTPGQSFEAVLRAKIVGSLVAAPRLLFYNGATQVASVLLFNASYPRNRDLLMRVAGLVPATATTVRFSLETTGSPTDGSYVDFGELGLRFW